MRFHKSLFRGIFIVWILSVFPIYTFSQDVSDAQVKTALVYNFLKFIDWQDEYNPDTIEIGTYGDDQTISEAFDLMDGKKSRNIPIKVYHFLKIEKIQPVDILYINYEYNLDIKRISRILEDYPVLFITDRHENKKEVMINFYHDESKKVKFELNSKNIKDAGISTSPKLLVLGGTELDIRELYKEVEQSLITEKEKTTSMERELIDKINVIDTLTDNLDDLSKFIRSQKLIISYQQKEIEIQKADLQNLQDELVTLNAETKEQQALLDIITTKLKEKNLNIKDLDSILLIKQIEYDSSINALNNLNNEIKQVQSELRKKNIRLNLQKTVIYISVAFLVLLVLFIINLYLNTRRSKFKNLELEKRNQQILEQKDRIEEQAIRLQEVNTKLEKQKHLLEDTLNQLKGAQSQLVASERLASLGQLTAGIIHEINNPVNFISSSVEGFQEIINDFSQLIDLYDSVSPANFNKRIKEINTLKEEIEYHESKEGIQQLSDNIRFGIQRTKEIISSLRTFSRVDEEEFTPTDINKNIDSALLLLGNLYKGRIRMVKNYANLPEIECISSKMNQVYINLLVNAIQAIKKEGKITIATSEEQKNGVEMVKISISDTGSGINKNILPQIFDPFFTTKEVGKGTGLGLSITYSIIQNHKGTIDVESIPGKGTTFMIHIPVKRE